MLCALQLLIIIENVINDWKINKWIKLVKEINVCVLNVLFVIVQSV